MPNPAALLLAAYNGKSTNTPGNNYGGLSPIGQQNPGQSSIFDPAGAAQNDVSQSQASYQNQQDSARSQLQTSLLPSSIGGGVGIGQGSSSGESGQGSQQNPLQSFNDAISGIQQRGVNQTQAVQAQAAQNWANKLSGLAQTFNQNSANKPSWTDADIQGILSKVPGYQQFNPSGGVGNYQQYVSSLPAGADPSSPGSRAIAIAKQSLGVPYLYGGNSLTQGVDCSGLVQQVYGKLGIQLPRTSTEQAKYGKIVPSLGQALPGDLILMYSPYEPAGLQQYGHVGLYIGNGLMLDAPHTGAVVRIEPIVNMTKIVRPW